MSLFSQFFLREKCTDHVDLSIGRVYIKPINHGTLKRVTIKSTVAADVVNNSAYLTFMEEELVVLSKRKQNNLSLDDGFKLREAIKMILVRHGLMTLHEEPKEEFSVEEKAEFQVQEQQLKERLKVKLNA